MANYKLVFRSGTLTGKEEQIVNEEIRIGRDPSCDITIDDVQISRNHVRLFNKEDNIYLEDLNSTNGTFINGKRITRIAQLNNGDLISLGENNVVEISILPIENKTRPDQSSEEIANHDLPEESEIIVPNQLVAEDSKYTSESSRRKQKQPAKKFLSTLPTWAVILFIAIGFFILFCLIPFIIIEVTNQWCNLFSGFFNAISPGICP